MSAEFTREVRFTKGYNRRHKPGGGVHGMRIAFILRGPMGAIQGDVQTGWVPGESMSPRTADLFPTGAGVHLHSAQQLKDWWMGPDKCDVLGGECYGDTGYSVSDEFTDCLKDEGEEAAWKYLESIYDSWFADDEVQS